ncbi:hypothetical protein [Stenotrophomonas sp.]|uniref:hypothetical protein n=1 Tax=Stenotrophomonas sp. TaxID=69392 RepID=UPI0028AE8B9E|nr:hypothetical protein [Stenotrophomonas sp.]
MDAIAREICLLARSATLVEALEAQSLLRKVAGIHGADWVAYRWWEYLSVSSSLAYGQDLEVWKQGITDLLDGMGQGAVYVAVTDDEGAPWPVVRIEEPACIVGVLQDMQFFEYFVFSVDCSRIFFDTHHNALVASFR